MISTRWAWIFGSFKGRISRKTFWGASLFIWLLFAMLFVFLQQFLGRPSTWILYPFFLWSVGAIAVKRLHDRGQSAWRLLLVAVPILGPVWLFVALGLRAGTRGDNQYGEDPHVLGVDYLTVRTS